MDNLNFENFEEAQEEDVEPPHVFAPTPRSKKGPRKTIGNKLSNALEQEDDEETRAAMEVRAWFGGDNIQQTTEKYFENPLLASDDEDDDEDEEQGLMRKEASPRKTLSQKIPALFKSKSHKNSDSPKATGSDSPSLEKRVSRGRLTLSLKRPTASSRDTTASREQSTDVA